MNGANDLKVALLGLMQSGVSTLFSAISGKEPSPMGATAIDEAIVAVPDERLEWLAQLYRPKKTVHATIDCLDVPGFNFADEHGRTAARRFLDKIRTADMLVLVVRAFENPSVPAYDNRVDPAGDLSILKTELLLADLGLVTTRVERLEKQVHKPTKTQAKDKEELAVQKKLQEAIEAEKPIRSAVEGERELAIIKSLGFLTLKPMIVVVNVSEGQLGQDVELGTAVDDETPVITLCAELEWELSQLDAASRADFMADMGIADSALSRFVNSCYSSLGLISFLTVGPDEVRAWPINEGTIAHDAAGKVHSDIKRGFIKAETMGFDVLKELGDEKAVKAAGKVRLEGKDYVVQDGDVINFRFNV
jgi:GTP-binding protein YchF